MYYNPSRALNLLREGTGLPHAQFREGQEDAIRHIVEGRGRILVVERTGWGKSAVYFIATKLLREARQGPTFLISPLIALMRNQIAAGRRMGIRAETIHSGIRGDELKNVQERIQRAEFDILLVSPERLANEWFRENVLAKVSANVSLLVIDEAHCISDWGHDFRPDYRRIERIIRTLPPNLRILATTATANKRVQEDLKDVLGGNLYIQRGSLIRTSLALQTIQFPTRVERLAWLAHMIPSLPGSGIVYVSTICDAKFVAKWLQSRGIKAKSYTGKTDPEERIDRENALLENRLKLLVASSALGMGFDKPDLAFVIHYQAPGSVVAYYQQVGRAGRALKQARGVLLSGEEDTKITEYFIESAFPTREEANEVLRVLELSENGLGLYGILGRANLTMKCVNQTLKILSLETPPPIVKKKQKWYRTAAPLREAFWERVKRLREIRYKELREMQEYVGVRYGWHMKFLINALDGDTLGVPPPPLPSLPVSVPVWLGEKAGEFLRFQSIPLNPRKRWPVSGPIPEDERPREGRALSIWRDGGWGDQVYEGKYKTGQFSDDLVRACVKMVKHWKPDPVPLWVTAIPTNREGNIHLVPDFANRLAQALNLPMIQVFRREGNPPQQKKMENSHHQVENVMKSLVINEHMVRNTPVLLIDDVADSCWTFTVAASKLRQSGCGPVYPLALTYAGQDV